MKLPPQIKTEILSTETIQGSFLKIDTNDVRFTYPDQSTAEMRVDAISRKLPDAVVIIPYFKNEIDNKYYVYLRSCLRTAVAVADYSATMRMNDCNGNIFELPAGLVDEQETGEYGLKQAVVRELEEEVGFKMDVDSVLINRLGYPMFSSPGIIAERLYFYSVQVSPNDRGKPTEDGSPLERGGIVELFSLYEALEYIQDGKILDCKTEIGLNRLLTVLSVRALQKGRDE